MDQLPIESNDDICLEAIFKTLVNIFIRNEKQDRVTVPLLDVLGLLYESGTLTKVTNEPL
jgi:hypothetical protein